MGADDLTGPATRAGRGPRLRSAPGSRRALACLGLAVLALLAAAGTASALPGENLTPIRAIAYQPVPSEYKGDGAGVYYDSDFFNADFQQLWGSANGGRGDLRTLASELGVNFLHLYDWNAPPARKHLPFLNEAAANGIRVGIPISNYFVFDDASAAAHIQAIVREVYSDAQGAQTTTPHPAAGMWIVSNEYDLHGGGDPATLAQRATQVAEAVARLVTAENAIGATERLPVSVPVSFATSFGPSSPPAVPATLAIMNALDNHPGIPPGFVSSRFVAAVNPFNPGSDLTSWLPQFKQAVPDTPLWFSELGTAVQNSCNSYPQPCTPSEQQQATFVADQLAAAQPGEDGILLGAAVFEFLDEQWKGGTKATFGISKYAGRYRAVVTTGGTYRVDDLSRKPSWTAVQNAFRGPRALLGAAGAAGLQNLLQPAGATLEELVEAAGATLAELTEAAESGHLDELLDASESAALAELLGASGAEELEELLETAVGGGDGGPGSPGACDPLLFACGLPETNPEPPPLAPPGGSDGGPAVSHPRMPDLVAGKLRARWSDGRVRVRLVIRVSKPRLAHPFDVRLRIPSHGAAKTVHVRPDGRSRIVLRVSLHPASAPVGSRVIAVVDSGKDLLETHEGNNTARARIP